MSGSALPEPLASQSSQAPETPSGSYRWYALGLLTVVYVVNFVDRQILSILLESIKEEFSLTDTELGFLAGISFALFYATLGIPIAMWADRGNRRNIITLALTVFSFMTALCGQATSFVYLAAARIGVGVGEAGASPPSHSILSDLFSPKERATALGIFATGVNIGIMIGFFVGGYINELYGWRQAFLVVGIPGLLLAIIVRLTLREPERGASEGRTGEAVEQAPSFSSAARIFWQTKTLRHISLASALNAFVGYGAVTWFASFLARSYQMKSSESGLYLALMFGVVGGVGTFFGGYFADVLAKRDIRWNLWLPAAVVIFAFPFTLGVFFSASATASLLFFIIPALVGTVYLGPSLAMVQALVPLRMRTVASAILLFVINIIGLGLGPQMVGVVSDLLTDRFADESLRYALLIASCINIWSAAHFIIAARSLKSDLPASREAMADAAA
jgi:predicted MFS family arabinose efflux permease